MSIWGVHPIYCSMFGAPKKFVLKESDDGRKWGRLSLLYGAHLARAYILWLGVLRVVTPLLTHLSLRKIFATPQPTCPTV